MEMAKRHEFTEEEIKEIKLAKKKNHDKGVDRRLQVLLLTAEKKSREEIAAATGYSKEYSRRIVTRYLKDGLEALTGMHYGGNRRNMSYSDEEEVLKPFRERAEAGHVVSVQEIAEAYDKKLGRKSNPAQIYQVLKRHNWRKVMPRSKHPKKATEEVIETSKKLTTG